MQAFDVLRRTLNVQVKVALVIPRDLVSGFSDFSLKYRGQTMD